MDFNFKKVLILSDEKINEKNDWDNIEKEMNFKFPKDYKEFIDIYGAGSINDFIYIFSPFCKNENLNLLNCFRELKDAYNTMKTEFPEDFELEFFDGEKGLFPFAGSDCGDLYWNVTSDDIKLFIYDDDYYKSIEYSMTMTEFLYKILDRTLDCPIFPNEDVHFLEEKNYYNRVD